LSDKENFGKKQPSMDVPKKELREKGREKQSHLGRGKEITWEKTRSKSETEKGGKLTSNERPGVQTPSKKS